MREGERRRCLRRPLAVAYLRTSSAANAGPDKDSSVHQLEAIHAYAAAMELVGEFHDVAVSGAGHLGDRPRSSDMLAAATVAGATTILVENASRFARDLIVQELGFELLKGRERAGARPAASQCNGPPVEPVMPRSSAVSHAVDELTERLTPGSSCVEILDYGANQGTERLLARHREQDGSGPKLPLESVGRPMEHLR
jgi:hypothetical protein